ncbi:MAG: hypothetical protein ACLQU4_10510 [Limisphaerales bacterium]
MNKKVEELRMANNELEAKMQPRVITQDQIDKFKAFLLGNPQKPVWVLCFNPSIEVNNLVATVRRMLNESGYTAPSSVPRGFSGLEVNGVLNPQGLLILHLTSNRDAFVVVMFNESDTSNPPPHGIALYNAFVASGIKAAKMFGTEFVEPGQAMVFIPSKKGF